MTTRSRPRDDDPERLRSPAHVRFFTAAMARRMQREFAGVRLSLDSAPLETGTARGRPLVLYANHPSWWDPAFLAFLSARLLPGRRAFAPIEAQALKRYAFMRRCGLFAIEPESRAGASRLLRIGTQLLARSDTLLCITPQGAFRDVRQRPLALRRGLAVLLARVPGAVAIPVALEYPFWNESRPEALARIGAAVCPADSQQANAGAWQSALTSGLEDTAAALRLEAMQRDPTCFTTLLDGSVGIGGVYDTWRRLAAWATGQRFDPAHGRPRPGTSS